MPIDTMPAEEIVSAERLESRSARTFAHAERHSRRVRWMKFLLPGLAVAGVAAFFSWSYLSVPSIEGVQVEGAALSDGKLVMANPKLDGFTRENLPYSMTAERAIQELDNTGVIQLENIDAVLPVSAENTAKVVARSGVFDSARNTLVIDSAVTVTTTDGMVANLKSAHFDIGSGALTTDQPVDIKRDGSRITADSMNVIDNGKVMVFERRVKVNLEPKKPTTGSVGKDGANVAQ